jgi:hypothetical protein
MRRFIFTLIAFSLTLSVFAQKDKTKTPSNWKAGGKIGLYGSQGGSRNWAAGSEKFSLAFAGVLNLWANRNVGKHTWANGLEIDYAMTNLHDVGVRKLDDKIDFVSKYTYDITNKFSVGVMFNTRTQMTNGFDYPSRDRIGIDRKRRISGFFAPAYITFAPGAELKITSYFSVFMAPLAAHWVVVTNSPYSFSYQGGIKPDNTVERSLASMYGVDPEKKVRFEAGPFVSAKFNKELVKNVTYHSRLDLFSDLTNDEPMNVDVFWNNSFSLKVNNWLQTSLKIDLIYDDNVTMFGRNKTSPAAQVNSMLGVGLTAKF